ncbi:uncharacterized protein LOC124132338 [Haliotis rufescens]|uniref:uncharacterized protein LOC124132338 n=1 Tax=Haliotis rufescens TaxID=6454 RepID=UPI001EB0AB58|nr:uncharacterized protein LOC124132338 [Haliotis rufescens]
MSKIYFVNISVTPLKEGMDMVLFVSKLAGLVQNYSNHTKILHKFKVTGEPQIVAIIEVADVIGLERTIAGLYRLGNVSVTCTPLYCYEDFANFLEVGPITFPGPLPENDLYWLEFDLEYKGKSLDQFVEIWRKEAHMALSSRAEGLPVALYKVLMERKVHVFLCVPDPAKLDEMAFNLPIMVENGENVHIKCKAIQMLDVFRQKVVA